MSRNLKRKERYNHLRDLGYSSKVARSGRDNKSEYERLVKSAGSIPKYVQTTKTPSTKGRQASSRSFKPSKSEIYKIRYNLYREAGYSPEEARKLRGRALDIGNLRLDRDGSVPRDSEVFQDIRDDLNIGKVSQEHKEYLYKQENDTVYSNWGMYTQDKRYRDDTMAVVKRLQDRLDISNDQAYYFYYTMVQYDKSYEEVKRELLSNEEFEMYDKNKRMRGRR